MRPLGAALAVLLATAGCAGFAAGPTPDHRTATRTPWDGRLAVTVTEIVDGDTIDVRFPGGEVVTVRLLGIDAPETHAENEPGEFEGVPNTTAGKRCLRRAGGNATAFLERLLGEDATVRVATDERADRYGPYGRLLAYVYYGGANVNRRLVAAGHARVYETTFARAEAFYAAEDAAMAAGRGLWRCRSAGDA